MPRSGRFHCAILFALLCSLACGASTPALAADGGTPTVATDRADYAPGEMVSISGTGWQAGELVHVTVNDTAGTAWSSDAEVTAADDGTIVLAVVLPGQLISDYTVTATGASSGTATTTFTDASALTLTTGTRTTVFNVSPSFQGSAFNDRIVTLTATNAAGAVVATLDTVPSCGKGGGACLYGSVSFPAGALPDGQLTVTATQPLYTGKPPQVTFFMDTQAPTASIGYPRDGATYGPPHSWGCSGEGDFCGSVGDPSPSSGAGAQIALRNAAGAWWNGSSYVAAGGPLWQAASGGVAWTYGKWAEARGTYTLYARGIDKAGNVGPAVSVTFTYGGDTTPPRIVFKQRPNGANGWFVTAPAELQVTVTDDLSGVSSLECLLDNEPSGNFFPGESGGLQGGVLTWGQGLHEVACTAADGAGNVAREMTTLKLDTTPPQTVLEASGTLSATGWYTSDVVVTTSGSDDVGEVACTAPQTISTDTAETSVTGMCWNSAGLMSAAWLTIRRDATPPEVRVTGVADGATYVRGAVPAAGCATHDATSETATEAAVTVGGGTVNGVGRYTATCSGATDLAGNAAPAVTATYTVVYDGVSGILQPINPDGTSVFNRGQVVPVKLRIAGDEGTAGYVTSVWRIARVPTACTGSDGVAEDVGSATPSTAFRYDASADQYVYNADMRDTAAGSCWRVRVTLDSGQVLTSAEFRER